MGSNGKDRKSEKRASSPACSKLGRNSGSWCLVSVNSKVVGGEREDSYNSEGSCVS